MAKVIRIDANIHLTRILALISVISFVSAGQILEELIKQEYVNFYTGVFYILLGYAALRFSYMFYKFYVANKTYDILQEWAQMTDKEKDEYAAKVEKEEQENNEL